MKRVIMIAGLLALALPAHGGNTCDGMWNRMPGAVARRAAKAYGRTQLGQVTLPSAMEHGVAVGATPAKFKRELERIWLHAQATKVAMYCAEQGSAAAVDDLFNAAVLPLLDEIDAGPGQIEDARCRKSTARLVGMFANLEYRFGKIGSRRKVRCSDAALLDVHSPALVASDSMRAVRDLFLAAQ